MCKTNGLTLPQEKNAFHVFTTTAVSNVAYLTVFSVSFHRPAVATRVLERVGNQPTLVCRHAALGVLGEGGGGEADGVDTHRPSHLLHQEPHQQRFAAPVPLRALPHAGVANGQLVTTALGDRRWVGRQVDDRQWVGRQVVTGGGWADRWMTGGGWADRWMTGSGWVDRWMTGGGWVDRWMTGSGWVDRWMTGGGWADRWMTGSGWVDRWMTGGGWVESG